MSTVTEERDLGIVIEGDLKFTSHVNEIVMKANKVLGTTIISKDANTIRFSVVHNPCSPNFGLWINYLESSSYKEHT